MRSSIATLLRHHLNLPQGDCIIQEPHLDLDPIYFTAGLVHSSAPLPLPQEATFLLTTRLHFPMKNANLRALTAQGAITPRYHESKQGWDRESTQAERNDSTRKLVEKVQDLITSNEAPSENWSELDFEVDTQGRLKPISLGDVIKVHWYQRCDDKTRRVSSGMWAEVDIQRASEDDATGMGSQWQPSWGGLDVVAQGAQAYESDPGAWLRRTSAINTDQGMGPFPDSRLGPLPYGRFALPDLAGIEFESLSKLGDIPPLEIYGSTSVRPHSDPRDVLSNPADFLMESGMAEKERYRMSNPSLRRLALTKLSLPIMVTKVASELQSDHINLKEMTFLAARIPPEDDLRSLKDLMYTSQFRVDTKLYFTSDHADLSNMLARTDVWPKFHDKGDPVHDWQRESSICDRGEALAGLIYGVDTSPNVTKGSRWSMLHFDVGTEGKPKPMQIKSEEGNDLSIW